jgi:beta-glucanase (GH16 family)
MKPIFTFLFLCSFIFIFSCEKEEAECQKLTFYKDADGDSLGNKAEVIQDCVQPTGYVTNASDSDDNPKTTPVNEIPTKGYSTPSMYPGMQLIWADEFEGTTLDEKNWNYELGDGCPGNCGWGNNELENYRKENTTVKNGYLFIQAKSEAFNGKQYTSSRLTTQNKVNIKYGRIDIRAALPKGKGIWPALWMLGKNINEVGWPKCGEIDIMEMVGGTTTDNQVNGTVHWDHNNSHAEYGGNTKLAAGIFNDEFHVFTITWDEKFIRWYLDDKQYHVIDITPSGLSELKEEFFLVFNVAVGGNWPGNPDGSTMFPQNMIVDYVRVFK